MTNRLCWLVGMGVLLFFVAACDRQREELAEEEHEAPWDEEARGTPGYGAVDGAEIEPIEPFYFGPAAPAVYFTAGLKGYTEPCGCTADVLLGGIDRITAFVKDARELHPAALMFDAGDWLFEHAELPDHMHPQERAKADVLARAHRAMGTLFSVPGNRDLALGVEFYLQQMEAAGMELLGANITVGEQRSAEYRRVELGDEKLFFVGAVEPALFENIEDVQVGDPVPVLTKVVNLAAEDEVVILVWQGAWERVDELVTAVPGIDFVVVGHDPRRRDTAESVGESHLVEVYDQGRYVGRLKFYQTREDGGFVDARRGNAAERQALQAQIEHVERDLRLLKVRTAGEPNAMTERLEERLEGLYERLGQLQHQVEIEEGLPVFLFDLIAMEPGYRLDEELQAKREAYNRSLAELNRDLQREVVPVEEGEPFFIGTPECAVCHIEAHKFWETTSHSSAVATLEVRDKAYDQNCIGCHVVGWEQPGGSVLGKLVYEAELAGRTFEKDLREVGCESCHGPGSNHRLQPINHEGVAQHIIRQPRETQCAQCHVQEHSPRFDFDVYVRRITGEGHRLLSAE